MCIVHKSTQYDLSIFFFYIKSGLELSLNKTKFKKKNQHKKTTSSKVFELKTKQKKGIFALSCTIKKNFERNMLFD